MLNPREQYLESSSSVDAVPTLRDVPFEGIEKEFGKTSASVVQDIIEAMGTPADRDLLVLDVPHALVQYWLDSRSAQWTAFYGPRAVSASEPAPACVLRPIYEPSVYVYALTSDMRTRAVIRLLVKSRVWRAAVSRVLFELREGALNYIPEGAV